MAKSNVAKVAPKAKETLISGLNANSVYTATGKLARAAHNVERHQEFNGMTVKEILDTKRMTPADIKYDIKCGFIKLVA